MLNSFSTLFSLTLTHCKAFRVEDVASVFAKIAFDFSGWEGIGTGNAAELQAGRDLEEAARYAFSTDSEASPIRL